MDDVEFFEEQKYFKLEELVNMIKILKSALFKMYWPSDNNYTNTKLKEPLTNLVQNLYDRKYGLYNYTINFS
jgi:hypothetical protein